MYFRLSTYWPTFLGTNLTTSSEQGSALNKGLNLGVIRSMVGWWGITFIVEKVSEIGFSFCKIFTKNILKQPSKRTLLKYRVMTKRKVVTVPTWRPTITPTTWRPNRRRGHLEQRRTRKRRSIPNFIWRTNSITFSTPDSIKLNES